MVPLPVIQRWISSLRPELPLTDPNDARYIDLDEGGLRGSDGSCIEQLARAIVTRAPEEPSCLLLSGYPGTGKTTDLARLSQQLRALGETSAYVVVVDAERYLDRYAPPSISAILRLLAWHLDTEAMEAEGKDASRGPGYLERLWHWLQADVEINKIGMSAYGVNLMAEIKNNPSFRKRVEEVLDLRFQKFAEQAHEVVQDAIARIAAARKVSRVVVVVDGLEKFTALRPEVGEEMEAAVEAVFCSHAAWLRIGTSVVYTFPLWLRFRRPDLGGLYDAPPLVMPMVKVRTREGAAHEPGIAKLTELVFQRIGTPVEVFGPNPDLAIRALIEASGGYPRDVLRLVRDVIQRAKQFPVSAHDMERVVQIVAEAYEHATLLSNLDVLRFIGRHHRLPEGLDEVRAASRLFELVQVMTYRNGEEWYDLHPLVARSRALTAVDED